METEMDKSQLDTFDPPVDALTKERNELRAALRKMAINVYGVSLHQGYFLKCRLCQESWWTTDGEHHAATCLARPNGSE